MRQAIARTTLYVYGAQWWSGLDPPRSETVAHALASGHIVLLPACEDVAVVLLADLPWPGEEEPLAAFLDGRLGVKEHLGVGRHDEGEFNHGLLIGGASRPRRDAPQHKGGRRPDKPEKNFLETLA
jgi:hypothetical protein